MKILFLLCLGFLICSCSSLEQSGLIMPKPKNSKHLATKTAGFVLKPGQKEVVLEVEVEVQFLPETAKYLLVDFPDGKEKSYRETKVIVLSGVGLQKARSTAMTGLGYLESYPVRIRLTADRAGEETLDELVQYVRFEVPPAALERLGVQL